MQEDRVVVLVHTEPEGGLEDAHLGKRRIRVKTRRRDVSLGNHYTGNDALGTQWGCNPAQDLRPQWHLPATAYLKMNESPRIASVVHGIVHQTCVLLRRSSLSGRVQVGFVRYSILKVTEIVAF